MAKQFLTPIDLTKNELRNAVIQNLASAPLTPLAGQVYFDTTLNQVLVWNGIAAAWQLKATDSLLLQGQSGAFYLARANQSGVQLASTISNLQATVVGYTLDTFAPPVASLNLNGQRLTNVATPLTGTDAANKAYVDMNVQGLQQKPTAQAASAAALPPNIYTNGAAGVGATLTAAANGVLTVDGYAVLLGDVLLLKNEAATANNGLYVVTTLGTAAVPYVLTRQVDMDQSTEFGGSFIAVENRGTAWANSLWLCNVINTITVGTTPVTFTQLNAATTYLQGNGISISGGVVSSVVAPAGGLSLSASGLALDTTVATRKYASDVGDGATTSVVVTHNLGTVDVVVGLYGKASPFAEVTCDVQHTTANTITLVFAVAPTAAQYRVVVHG